MARFKTEVKLFALDARAQGKAWKAIKDGVEEKFNIKPPTIRAMQKWEKNLDRTALTAELMKDIKRQMPAVEKEVQVCLAQELIPMLWKAKEVGEDIEATGWKWFLQLIDRRLGSQRFERMINEYMAERGKAK